MSEMCPIHSQPWRTVPAGISKTTGKPYNSFRACPVPGCQQRPPRASNPVPRPLPQPEGQTSVLSDPRKSDAVLVAACLNFAARIYQGLGDEYEAIARRVAKEVYAEWKART